MCWSVKNNSLKCPRVIVLSVALQVIESLYALWFISSVSDTLCNYCTKDDLHVHLEKIISVRYNPSFLQSVHFCQQFNQDLRI